MKKTFPWNGLPEELKFMIFPSLLKATAVINHKTHGVWSRLFLENIMLTCWDWRDRVLKEYGSRLHRIDHGQQIFRHPKPPISKYLTRIEIVMATNDLSIWAESLRKKIPMSTDLDGNDMNVLYVGRDTQKHGDNPRPSPKWVLPNFTSITFVGIVLYNMPCIPTTLNGFAGCKIYYLWPTKSCYAGIGLEFNDCMVIEFHKCGVLED